MAETPDLALVARLKEVLADQPVTETELRRLIDEADGLVRALDAQITSSEQRLIDLSGSDDSSLTEIAAELQRVESLRPKLDESRELLAALETRARELRTTWLLGQADNPLAR